MAVAWTDYLMAAISYNLQILPESLLVGALVLSVVLANWPLMAVAIGAGGTQLLSRTIGRLVMRFDPNNASVRSSMDVCTTGVVGRTWERLLYATSPNPDVLWHPAAPSIYMVTISFFMGWGFALQQLYKEEIAAGLVNKSILNAMIPMAILMLIIAFAFRVISGCDSIMGSIVGTLLGMGMGYGIATTLGYATERRATNLWGIALLRPEISHPD